MDSNHLEAVEQASLVFCYHARRCDVTHADVLHQVSGAADQDGEDLLVIEEEMNVREEDELGRRHFYHQHFA